MTRINKRMPIKGPFNASKSQMEVTAPMRRAGVIKTLRAIGNPDGELDLVVLHKHDASPKLIREAVNTILGKPDNEAGETLEWSDGLKIRLFVASSGPLAEALPFYELPEGERAGLTKAQQDELERARQDQENERAAAAMAAHIAHVRRGR